MIRGSVAMRPKGSKNKFPAKIIPLEERFSQRKLLKGLNQMNAGYGLGQFLTRGMEISVKAANTRVSL